MHLYMLNRFFNARGRGPVALRCAGGLPAFRKRAKGGEHAGFRGEFKERRAVLQKRVDGVEGGRDPVVQRRALPDQARQAKLAVHDGRNVFHAENVVRRAAEVVRAEYDRPEKKIPGAVRGNGGVQLAAVEKGDVALVRLEKRGAALHGDCAVHYAEKLHFAVPMAVYRRKAVLRADAVLDDRQQLVAVPARFLHVFKFVCVDLKHHPSICCVSKSL